MAAAYCWAFPCPSGPTPARPPAHPPTRPPAHRTHPCEGVFQHQARDVRAVAPRRIRRHRAAQRAPKQQHAGGVEVGAAQHVLHGAARVQLQAELRGGAGAGAVAAVAQDEGLAVQLARQRLEERQPAGRGAATTQNSLRRQQRRSAATSSVLHNAQHAGWAHLNAMLPAFSWKNITVGRLRRCSSLQCGGHMSQACRRTPSAAVSQISS